MNVDGVFARQIVLDLADRLEERQALDIADGAADLAQHKVKLVIAVEDEILDGVGDVRDHLDGGAEIVAAPLLGQDVLVDAPGSDVVGLTGRTSGEALVMAEGELWEWPRASAGPAPSPVTTPSPCWYGDIVPGSRLR